MAFGITFDIGGMTSVQYDRLGASLNAMAVKEPGFILHFAHPTETGYRITEVWETALEQQRFSQEKVAPLFLEEHVPPASVQTFEVRNVVTR